MIESNPSALEIPVPAMSPEGMIGTTVSFFRNVCRRKPEYVYFELAEREIQSGAPDILTPAYQTEGFFSRLSVLTTGSLALSFARKKFPVVVGDAEFFERLVELLKLAGSNMSIYEALLVLYATIDIDAYAHFLLQFRGYPAEKISEMVAQAPREIARIEAIKIAAANVPRVRILEFKAGHWPMDEINAALRPHLSEEGGSAVIGRSLVQNSRAFVEPLLLTLREGSDLKRECAATGGEPESERAAARSAEIERAAPGVDLLNVVENSEGAQAQPADSRVEEGQEAVGTERGELLKVEQPTAENAAPKALHQVPGQPAEIAQPSLESVEETAIDDLKEGRDSFRRGEGLEFAVSFAANFFGALESFELLDLSQARRLAVGNDNIAANMKAFHAAALGQPNTLVLVKTEDGKAIFGGFLSVPWADGVVADPSRESFIFTLANPLGKPPTKFALKADRTAWAAHLSESHFAFGKEQEEDWIVFTRGSYSNFGNSYEDTMGNAGALFGGQGSGKNRRFKAGCWELWQLG